MNWRPVFRVGINLFFGFSFAGAVGLYIIGFAPAGNWAKDFRMVGLAFNVGGALLTLLPRAMRGLTDVEDQTSRPIDTKSDTIIALTGITVIMVGFLLQLVGNVLSA